MERKPDRTLTINNHKIKLYYLEDLVYKTKWNLLVGGTPVDLAQFIKAETGEIIENIPDITRGMLVTTYDPSALFLWLQEDCPVSTVAHEAFHLTCKILFWKGISLTESSEEAYAYLFDYWFREIMGILDKEKVKNDKK